MILAPYFVLWDETPGGYLYHWQTEYTAYQE